MKEQEAKKGQHTTHRFGAQSYDCRKKFLIDSGESFIISVSGSMETLTIGNKTYVREDIGEFSGKGFHLSKMVKQDVADYLEEHGEVDSHGHDYMEQMFDLNNINRVVGKTDESIVAIDINDCYWKTIYNLGYITNKTYLAGRRKKEWKLGRNASIGSLAKTKVVVPYENGKMVLSKKQTIKQPEGFVNVRSHVINHVYRMFEDLRHELGTHFFMFLTDCVFVNVRQLGRVKKYFKLRGYDCKHSVVEFTDVDYVNRIIKWKKFPDYEVNTDGSIKYLGFVKDKYYCYSSNQVVQTRYIEKLIMPEILHFTESENRVTELIASEEYDTIYLNGDKFIDIRKNEPAILEELENLENQALYNSPNCLYLIADSKRKTILVSDSYKDINTKHTMLTAGVDVSSPLEIVKYLANGKKNY